MTKFILSLETTVDYDKAIEVGGTTNKEEAIEGLKKVLEELKEFILEGQELEDWIEVKTSFREEE
jgi:hypothetical protein